MRFEIMEAGKEEEKVKAVPGFEKKDSESKKKFYEETEAYVNAAMGLKTFFWGMGGPSKEEFYKQTKATVGKLTNHTKGPGL